MADVTRPGSPVLDERWTQIKKIVDRALDLAAEDRAKFLDRSCRGDADLRAEVESLLSFEGDSFLESAAGRARVPHDFSQLVAGTRLGPYEIQTLIGAGGMGEIYRATDTRLQRIVALKILPIGVAGSTELRQRLEREAKAISQLNHPHICTLYDIGSEDDIDYLVMEYIEGETLTAKLQQGPLAIETALEYAIQITSGLEMAHSIGIVHRDLKPDNIMLTGDGVKLLDFGIAKRTQAGTTPESIADFSDSLPSSSTAATTAMTRQGTLLGTVPYMSPEQARGQAIDHFSDQFSFGAVLYEMLSGQRPFEGASMASIRQQILDDTPAPLRGLRPEIDEDIEAIVDRCLHKAPSERFAQTSDLHEALLECQRAMTSGGLRLSPRTVLASLAGLALVASVSAWYWFHDDIVRWTERDALAKVGQFIEAGELADAFRLIDPVRDKLPDDPVVRKLLERFTIPVTIATDPPGAQVKVQGYLDEDDRWTDLGETPLAGVRLPYALMRWRISKAGFETIEGAPFGERSFIAFAQAVPLDAMGSRPKGMVRVPGGPYQRVGFPPVQVGDYWLDRYEVSNREFKAFVDAGGYHKPEYWREAMAGEQSSTGNLIDELRDATGQPGPAGWRDGSFAQGQADFPVGGVSWYEAVAYCEFVGKQLPTLFHWSAATVQNQLSDIIGASNFDGQGPAEIGSHRGLSDFGNYDLAGNLREWVWNQASLGRYILGGSWSDPVDRFRLVPESIRPESREPNNGFRCARHDEPAEPALFGRFTFSVFEPVEIEPVSDEAYEIYRRMYTYDRTKLEPTLVAVDDSSPQWRKETISFAAAYGGEQMLAHVYLPRNATPPYQTVLWVPGNDAFMLPGGDVLASQYLFDFVPGTGRALVYPVYKGTYERHVPFSFSPNDWRDLIIAWSKDLSRTVDYLELRPDIDSERLGYFGFSAGALYGPIFTTVDPRFKASVLLAGGLVSDFEPEVSAASFAAHSRVPTLMVNGKDDFLNPYEAGQLALLRMLGAAPEDKRHVRVDGGHIVPDRPALIAEFNAWMDRYLGPVDQ